MQTVLTAGTVQAAEGTLVGVVRGPGGVGLPGVTVTALSTEGDMSISVVTGQGGNFKIGGLEPGIYSVVGELSGFHSTSARGLGVTSRFSRGHRDP